MYNSPIGKFFIDNKLTYLLHTIHNTPLPLVMNEKYLILFSFSFLGFGLGQF